MLGPYQLVEAIGRGGMGEVWSARDTRLDRMVALKFASSDFSERFAREARLIAALNHPNVCTLYDVGPNFLVMELIEGRQLDQVIPKSGLRLNEALHYAVDIADAVAAAHARGIVHRDLKPGNVMITPQGRVKVLDFGLAKLAAIANGDDRENVTTIETSVSGEGTIVGTTAYMSPEQAQGLPVDARSDIFSYGVLLYEMLTGVRPFSGDTKAATLAALINQEPRLARELASIPAELDRLLTRSLRKDPKPAAADHGGPARRAPRAQGGVRFRAIVEYRRNRRTDNKTTRSEHVAVGRRQHGRAACRGRHMVGCAARISGPTTGTDHHGNQLRGQTGTAGVVSRRHSISLRLGRGSKRERGRLCKGDWGGRRPPPHH
jgi:serine/threonine protein kinase